MTRFYYAILISIPIIIYYICKAEYYANHRERYDEDTCYRLAKNIVNWVKRNARVKTISYGEENLPDEGGYIMYSNHQGRYDAIGIISAHDKPCSVVMDSERSKLPIAKQVVDLLCGVRMNKADIKQQVRASRDVRRAVEQGRRFIYFPEGKYEDNRNTLQEFHPGAFKCAQQAKAPIVPVAIYDSHIVFDFNSLKKVTTQVLFMEPIYYEEYGDMTTREISDMVKERIEEGLCKLDENRRRLNLNPNYYTKCKESI
ncbi:MAG: 1-acyl-sn-glycerol-3-phosphate acyltransferase [Lachnospiraceae bacterium]|mgnify:CR=1 FL=1|nr:1-acyl-sn-glycerol-3-phosphate acyltransferase [Lachnospiraceae bacterium]